MSLMKFFQFFLKKEKKLRKMLDTFLKKEKKLRKMLDTGLKIVLYGRPSTLKRGREKKKRLTLKMG